MEGSLAGGRAKRKSAQSAQDAQLARALQEEILRGNRGKKPKCEELGIRIPTAVAPLKRDLGLKLLGVAF